MNTDITLQELIQSSSLTQEESDELLHILTNVDDENLQILTELLTENNDWARVLSKNYKDKVAAFTSGDKDALKEILNREARL
jgi:ABC-type uncharacterized transport system fused permease/ATPase subunit